MRKRETPAGPSLILPVFLMRRVYLPGNLMLEFFSCPHQSDQAGSEEPDRGRNGHNGFLGKGERIETYQRATACVEGHISERIRADDAEKLRSVRQ